MTMKSDDPRSEIITFKQTRSERGHLDEMTCNGNRSAFLRALIEAEWQKRQEQK